MKFTRWIKQFIPIALVFLLFATACASAPSKYDQVQKDTSGSKAPAAVAKEAERGGTFNQFFPRSEGDYEVVPAQEKKGFAEYKLKRNGETLAMLSINDTISVPAAAAKYESTSDELAGYPAVQQGATATGVLVNGRYQVKVLSRETAFTAEDRAAWIQKFDLEGLAQLDASDMSAAMPSRGKKQLSPKRKEAPAIAPESSPGLVPQPAT